MKYVLCVYRTRPRRLPERPSKKLEINGNATRCENALCEKRLNKKPNARKSSSSKNASRS